MNDADSRYPTLIAEHPLLNRDSLTQLAEDVGSDLLPDILGTFLVESERRMDLLAECADARDCKGVADQAHALKGSAGTFGAMAMYQVALDLELAGRASDRAAIERMVPDLRRVTRETCELLRRENPLGT